MCKVERNVANALNWITTYNHNIWVRCARKKKFLNKNNAVKYIKEMKNSKPIMPYKCYICGFYHIGTCFEKGKKIVCSNKECSKTV